MTNDNDRPAWWQVTLLALGVLGLLVWGALAHLSERGHMAVAAGTVLLAWVMVEAWLRANRRALLHIEGLHLVERPAMGDRPADADGSPRPVLLSGLDVQAAVRLPASGPAHEEGGTR